MENYEKNKRLIFSYMLDFLTDYSSEENIGKQVTEIYESLNKEEQDQIIKDVSNRFTTLPPHDIKEYLGNSFCKDFLDKLSQDYLEKHNENIKKFSFEKITNRLIFLKDEFNLNKKDYGNLNPENLRKTMNDLNKCFESLSRDDKKVFYNEVKKNDFDLDTINFFSRAKINEALIMPLLRNRLNNLNQAEKSEKNQDEIDRIKNKIKFKNKYRQLEANENKELER